MITQPLLNNISIPARILSYCNHTNGIHKIFTPQNHHTLQMSIFQGQLGLLILKEIILNMTTIHSIFVMFGIGKMPHRLINRINPQSTPIQEVQDEP